MALTLVVVGPQVVLDPAAALEAVGDVVADAVEAEDGAEQAPPWAGPDSHPIRLVRLVRSLKVRRKAT